jgi:selenocysteine-specific elongation factor
VGTDQVGARVGSSGREAVALDADRSTALLRLDAPVAVAIGDRFVLRRPSPGEVEGGGTVLDPLPPTGPARRRITLPRIAALRHAVVEQGAAASVVDALADLHGALAAERVAAAAAISRAPAEASAGATEPRLAADLEAELAADAVSLVVRSPADADGEARVPAAEIRRRLASRLARTTGLPERSATTLVDRLVSGLVSGGLLARDGERLRDPSVAAGPPPELLAAMDRLERLLNATAPPPLARAAEDAACPAAGIRALQSGGRIVRVEADLAWSAPAYHRLAAQALAMARAAPLSPAAFRDATGTSRRYVLAILEDLDRRGILQRGPDGHRPGPRAPRASPAGAGTRET